ncbi:MAG: hypothetical protein U0795_04655 [Pirellulales bacterium]
MLTQSRNSTVLLIRHLNQLLQLHSRSLPVYLACAQPWRPAGQEQSAELLAAMADDHQRRTNEIADYILDLGGVVQLGEFPLDFADLHDLSHDYVWRVVASQLTDHVAQIEGLVGKLGTDPRGRALAEEALGAAKGHLQSVTELLSQLKS